MLKKSIAVSSLIVAFSIFPIISTQVNADSGIDDEIILAQQKSKNIGILKASNPYSKINFRSKATTDSQTIGYGLTGDGVEIIGCSSEYGDTWLQVRFFKPPYATGWIRADLIYTPVSLQYC